MPHDDRRLTSAQRAAIVAEGLPAPQADAAYHHGVTAVPLEKLGRTHFVGIGGAGMSAVARVLAGRGIAVSGSDAQDSPSLRELSAFGIRTHVGHDAAHIAGVDTLVVSSAIRPTNPEYQAALKLGLPIIHRSMALAAAATGRETIAVAGTHGKTTTTSMVAVMLKEVGEDPSFAVGGAVTGLGVNAHLGQGDAFVLEADESDGSYVNYQPRVAIVTNIEPDHLDFYGSAEAVTRSFDTFVELLDPDSTLVACADDPGSSGLAERHRATAHVRTYGYAEDADVQILSTEPFGRGTRSTLSFTLDGLASEQELVLTVPGNHNVLNAAAAFTAGLELGLDPERCALGLGAFLGASRRFELKGEVSGIRVYDDYAHHPTEVTAALNGARNVVGEGRVLVIFQPHLYSRTLAFGQEFATALDTADLALVLPIYRAREDVREDVTSATITDLGDDARRSSPVAGLYSVASMDEAVTRILETARPGDLVMTIGAGDVTQLGSRLVEGLESRAAETR